MTRDIRAGEMIGDYRVTGVLGKGANGVVYAAIEPRIGRLVAIKVLRGDFAEGDRAAARLLREARAANDIRHPGIVDVYAIGTLDDGRPYLVMSMLEGRSLRAELLARVRLPAGEAWAIARRVGEALAAAHAAGIVHRDLKPDNVFLERRRGQEPKPIILDFGLAKTDHPDDAVKLTQSGAPVGTPVYMAPEQWWGAGVDARADQYAFGAMVFEMLSGRPPFTEMKWAALMQQHLHEAPPTLASVGASVSPEVEALLAKALAKSADDRFESMETLLAAGDEAFSFHDAEVAKRAPPTMESADAGDVARAESDAREARDALEARSSPADAGRVPSAARHAVVLLLGLAALIAVGYTGYARHRPLQWIFIAGWGVYPTLVSFLIGALLAPRIGRRVPLGAFWFALVPAFFGAIGAHSGLFSVEVIADVHSATDRFGIYGVGAYEALTGRFLGYSLSSLLCLSLALGGWGDEAIARTPTSDRAALAAGTGLLLLGAGSAAAGAPWGCLCAMLAALIVLGDRRRAVGALQGEVAGALAALLSTGLAVAAGLGRSSAREAVLWDGSLTRGARAAEIIAAAGEHKATISLSLAALVVVAWHKGRRLSQFEISWREIAPTWTAWVLIAFTVVMGVSDMVLLGRYVRAREDVRTALAAQFQLFARLDPPGGDALDAMDAKGASERAPHRAAALQIASDAIAVNGAPVAKLLAVESSEGALNLGRDLGHALGEAARSAGADDPDLSISIDREVPYGLVLRALSAARRAGARRAEILLTKGPAPPFSPSAPPETHYVLASDFVALSVELADDGFQAGDEEVFGAVAPRLVEASLAAKGPIKLLADKR